MAHKTPAVSTQLRAALAKIEELEKKIKSEETNLKYSRENNTDLTRQIEEVQTFLDALPECIARTDAEKYGAVRSPMTRLAAWFATRAR